VFITHPSGAAEHGFDGRVDRFDDGTQTIAAHVRDLVAASARR
jgi:hypothetical protein